MGSHGGGTAAGQTDVLCSMGITEQSVRMPIRSTMDTVHIADAKTGLPVFMDRYAYEADGVIAVNRIKLHTGFRARYESGLMKMLAVGLGNQKGANIVHSKGLDSIPVHVEAIANTVIENKNILAGVGVIENAYDETCNIRVLRKEEIPVEEPALLRSAARQMAAIKFGDIDVLIIDRIGKNYCGNGFDLNIVRRFVNPSMMTKPLVKKIVVLGLSKETNGNANGIGLADITSRRVVDQIDFSTGYINAMTSGVSESTKIPIIMPNDLLAIQAALQQLKLFDPKSVRLVRIANTKELSEVSVSECMRKEALAMQDVSVLGLAEEMIFDLDGYLV